MRKGPARRPVAERFHEKTRSGPACPVEWAGQTNPWIGGYGLLWVPDDSPTGGRKRRAHHVAWFLATGEWPPADRVVCHTCDNPPCVTFGHLFIGTHADNVADKVAKGRQPQGAAHGRSKLTDEQVLEIRAAHASGETQASLTRRFDLTSGAVSMICARRRWNHLKENA